MPSDETGQRHAEGFAAFTQAPHASFELLCRLRCEPGAKPQHASRDRRVGDKRKLAFDVGLAIG